MLDIDRLRDIRSGVWRALPTGIGATRTRVLTRARASGRGHAAPALAQGDGEIIGRTPVSVRVMPSTLRVLVARAVEGTLPAEAPAETDTSDPPVPPGAAPPGRPGQALRPTPSRGVVRSIPEEAIRMLARRSRTWALQSPLRHPLAALEAYDAAIFLKVNSMSLGRWVDRALELVSRFIHYGEGWAAVVLLIVLVDLRRGLHVAVETLPALWATIRTVNLVLKHYFRRPVVQRLREARAAARGRRLSFRAGTPRPFGCPPSSPAPSR